MARWTPDTVDTFDDSRDFERYDDEPYFENGVMVICAGCNGSGEGMYDGSRCSTCRGSGEVMVEGDDEDEVDEDMDDDPQPGETPVTPNRVTTSTGIHIGGAYIAPPAQVSNDAVFFQDLLRGYDVTRRAHRETAIVVAALIAAAIAWWLL